MAKVLIPTPLRQFAEKNDSVHLEGATVAEDPSSVSVRGGVGKRVRARRKCTLGVRRAQIQRNADDQPPAIERSRRSTASSVIAPSPSTTRSPGCRSSSNVG